MTANQIIEQIVIKYFPNAKFDSVKKIWTAKTKPNKNDAWDKPETLDKCEYEIKHHKNLHGIILDSTSWDDYGNLEICLH